MKANLLQVVCAISNPLRLESRIRLYRQFEAHMLASGVALTVVECAYGDRDYECAGTSNVRHVPVRAKTLVWAKENLLNLGVNRVCQDVPDARYFGCFDADIHFRSPTWAEDAVHQLQIYDVIQPWATAYDLGPNGEHLAAYSSFCKQLFLGAPVHGPKEQWKWAGGAYEFAHPGYAWCYTRQALDALGGMLECAGMGSGDHHMALSLAGLGEHSMHGKSAASYRHTIMEWQRRALSAINHNIGYCEGTIEHHWHGRKADRRYVDRWQMFVRHGFDPAADLLRNSTGALEFASHKPLLRREFARYLLSRDEDRNSLL